MFKLFILVLAMLAIASAQYIATSPYVAGAAYGHGLYRAGGYVAAPAVLSSSTYHGNGYRNSFFY
jgi:hypothetical protein